MTRTVKRRAKTGATRATHRRAAAASPPQSLNNTARTVRATIATDTPVQIYDDLGNGEYGWIDEVLLPAGMIEPLKMPLRLDHYSFSSRSVIGRVTDFEITETDVNATLTFSRAADVEEIYTRVSEGNLDSVSIGATYKMADTTTLQPGQTARYGKSKYTASDRPMRIVEKWNAHETSVVDQPADPKAVIRSQIRTAKNNRQQLPESIPGTGGPISTEDKMTKTTRRQAARSNGPSNQSSRPTKERRAARQAMRAVIATNGEGPDDTDTDTDAGDGEGNQQVARQQRPNGREALEQADRRADARTGTNATPDQIEAARQEERARVSRIRELGQGQPDEIVTRAISDGLSPEQFGLAVLERLRGQSAGHQTSQSGDGVNRAPAVHQRRGATVESLQAAVLLRAGVNLQNPVFGTEAARVVLERSGCGWLHAFNSEIGSDGNSQLEQHIEIGRRFQADSAARTCERILGLANESDSGDVEEMVQRSFSTPYLPRVFGAIVSVGLIQGYAEFPDSTLGWTGEADWPDFRINQPIGLESTQGLRRHTRGTEAKDVDFADYGEAYAVSRYTGRFVLDEMDIIDDTVGANQTMPQQMGLMAARLRPDLVYAVLQNNGNLGDGTTLFHSSRGNVVTTNPLTLDNLGKAEQAMAAQIVKNKSGVARPLNLMAGFLIVPRALRPLGKQITASTLVVSGNTTQAGNANPFSGEYQLRSDARLDVGVVDPRTETKLSGSATTWYIAEQSGQQAIQVGYRRGTGRAPSIRVRPLTQPGQFGIGWDIAHDVGVGVIKAAAMVRCTA